MCATRFFRISAAKMGPNQFHQNRTVVADIDPALGQKVLDVAQRQRVFHAHHYRQANYLWRTVEISERVADDRNLPQTRGGPK
jgi:hypothetical protein